MKRDQIKKRPMSDTTLATLEPEAKEYREPDGKGLYFRVKPDGNKSWQLRYKKPNGTWSFLGLGAYPEVSGQLARQKAAELLADSSTGADLIVTKQQRKQAELDNNNATFERLIYEFLDNNKPKSDAVFIMALRRLGYEGRQSPHGFRHIASTTLREKVFLRDHVEAALAHKVGGVEGVYNKADYLADRIPMMQWWADYLEGLRTDSNIIPFSKAANA
ncbi:MAG: integrase family protein [Moraxellaceae bacterium]